MVPKIWSISLFRQLLNVWSLHGYFANILSCPEQTATLYKSVYFFNQKNAFYLQMFTKVGIIMRWATCSKIPFREVFKELMKYSVLHCIIILEEPVCLIKWFMKSEFVKLEDLVLCVHKDLLLDFVLSLLNWACSCTAYFSDILIWSFPRCCASSSMHAVCLKKGSYVKVAVWKTNKDRAVFWRMIVRLMPPHCKKLSSYEIWVITLDLVSYFMCLLACEGVHDLKLGISGVSRRQIHWNV
jgi:hypothetical protein